MKKLSLNYASFLLILITNCTDFYAQKGIVVSGANVSTSSGSISSSIGQVDYQSSFTDNNHVSEGMQQPYEITEILSTKKMLQLEIKLYPNPTSDIVIIEIIDLPKNTIKYELTDIEGRLIYKGMLYGSNSISLKEVIPSTYILRVFDNKSSQKTFKIIKQ